MFKRRKFRYALAATTALALLVSSEQAMATLPSDLKLTWSLPALQKEKSVPGSPVAFKHPPTSGSKGSGLVAPKWPAAADTDVTLADGPQDTKQPNGVGVATKATGTPVTVARTKATDARKADAAASQVHVHVTDHAASDRLGLTGMVFSLTGKANLAATEPVRVTLDYKDFATGYGGGWGDRLQLVTLPACSLSTPDKAECRVRTPVPTTNNVGARTLSADVPLAQGQVLAADPDQKGSSGTFQAQPLSPAGSWSSGGSSGTFSYTYPFATPPGINGANPALSMGYMSQMVDGLTSGTNNQASWVGDGWDFTAGGYVERHFQSCTEDIGGNNPKPGTGDNCYAVENATLVLGGKSTELVKDKGSGRWVPKDDDGAKVEILGGAANNAWNGEYWKVTAPDGTQYFLGLNRLPGWASGKPETQSVWTVPVFSNNPDEPCYHDKFIDSHCDMAWRWNLDYVVDPNNNVTTYYYQSETNYYGMNLNRQTAGTKYTAGGYPLRIEYGLHLDKVGPEGQKVDSVYATDPAARITFDTAERCLPTATFDCAPAKLTAQNALQWPDVPFDQVCNQGAVCMYGSPSFFSRKRLTGVHTQIGAGAGKFSDVDAWQLKQSFPGSGDASPPAMWLDEIVHTGKANGGSITLPSTKFTSYVFPNRVDTVSDKYAPLTRRRLIGIENDTGGYIGIAYSGDDSANQYCKAGVRMPTSPDQDKLRCYASWWSPPSAHEPVLDYFHKYLVTDVTEEDLTGGGAPVKVHYDYLGDPAWHYDEGQFTKEDRKTWGQWRGYEKIRTTTGEASAPKLVTETTYLRGMDGDHLSDGSLRHPDLVKDSAGGTIVDQEPLQGIAREIRSYSTAGGTPQSTQITHPWLSAPTATGADGLLKAYMIDTDSVTGRTLMADGKTYRTSTVTKQFNERGLTTQVEDLGDTAVTGDETCTKTFYFPETFNQEGIRDRTKESKMYAGTCSAEHTAANNITDVRVSYDGQAFGTPPTRGNITETDTLDSWDAKGQVFVPTSRNDYDKYGRETSSKDVFDKVTTTKYTPDTGGPVTGTTTTNTYGWTSSVEIDPNWGYPKGSVDPNNVRMDTTYDALGRKTAVWANGRSKPNGDTATAKFTYTDYDPAKSLPVSVESKAVQDDGSYASSFAIYDGLGRARQTQSPAAGKGRIVSDQVYDARGLVYKTNNGFYNEDSGPTRTLIAVADNQVPNQTVTEFDSRARPTASIFFSKGVEQWRTTTVYEGERTTTIPPAGGTPRSVVTNVQGRVAQVSEYVNGYTVGAANPADTTSYTYNAAGAITSMTDSSNNKWAAGYDMRGRRIWQTDPDAGKTTYAYDKASQMTSTTDSRNKTQVFTYDDLGRRTRLNADSATGPKLATWEYDTLPNGRGLLTSSTRWDGTNQYVSRVTGYDDYSRPTGTQLEIPAAENGLAGTYTFPVTYSATGAVAVTSSPGKGGLPAEHVFHTFDGLGLPSTSYIVDDATGKTTDLVSKTEYTSYKEVSRLQFDADKAATDVWLTQTYDEATRRPATTTVDRATQTDHQLTDRTYGYDPAGNVTKIADTPDAGLTDVQCFAYDYLQRMSEAWTPKSQDCTQARAANTMGGAAPYWNSYTYDKTGNRKSLVSHTLAGDTKSTYTYPTDGSQPHALKSVTTTAPGAGAVTTSYSYDNAGNTLTRGNQTFTYDTEGHSNSSTDQTGSSTYVYDADGNRLISRDPTGSTLTVGDMELFQAKGSTAVTGTRFYTHAGDAVAERTGNGGLTWMLGDHHGTNTLAITAGGRLPATVRYSDPFGGARGPQVTWPDKHGFVGGYQDTTGLTHLGARDYDPATGRFTQPDPELDPGMPQSWNGYAYANNAPATQSDPSGLQPCHQMGEDGLYCNPQAHVQGCSGQCHNNPPPSSPGAAQAGAAAAERVKQANHYDEAANRQAHETVKKNKWDVFADAAGEVIKSLIGWDDISDCVGKGDVGSCISVVVQFIPWGKIFKIGEIIADFWRGAKALINFGRDVAKAEKVIKDSERVLKEAADAAADARRAVVDAERAVAEEARAAQAAKASGTGGSGAPKAGGPSGGCSGDCPIHGPTSIPGAKGKCTCEPKGTRRADENVEINNKETKQEASSREDRGQAVSATVKDVGQVLGDHGKVFEHAHMDATGTAILTGVVILRGVRGAVDKLKRRFSW